MMPSAELRLASPGLRWFRAMFLAAACAVAVVHGSGATTPPAAPGDPPAPLGWPAEEVVAIDAVADAIVDSFASGENYGLIHTLEVRYGSPVPIRRSLLRFNLATALPEGAIIDAAWLELLQTGWAGADYAELRAAPITEDWIESQVTWDSRPATGIPELILPSASAQAPVRFEITEIAHAWQEAPNFGLQLAEVDDQTVFSRVFESREPGGHPPRLEVTYHLPFQPLLEGYVYEGRVGEEDMPLSGVAVELLCSDHDGEPGQPLAASETNAEGWYGFDIPNPCPFYNLIEHDPADYRSAGASSVGGRVILDNWIQYEDPLHDKVLDGNLFWDLPAPPPSSTPTASATATGVPSPTVSATSIVQPTDTASPTPVATHTAGASPSPTESASPEPIWHFTGQVLDSEDRPAAGLEIRLLGGDSRASPGQVLDWGLSDPSGRFELHYEPAGGSSAAFSVMQIALPAAGLEFVDRRSESGGLAGEGDWLDFLQPPAGSYNGNLFRVRYRFPTDQPPLRLCASADAWVGQDDPAANHGQAGTLRTGYYTRVGTSAYRTFLGFSLDQVPTSIEVARAELELNQLQSGGPDPLELRAAAVDERWAEDTVTWENQPPQREEPLAIAALAAGTGARRWDVTEIVRAWRDGQLPALGLALSGPEGDVEWWRDFESRENPKAPRLLLYPSAAPYEPEPSALVPQTPRLVLSPDRGMPGDTFWMRGYNLPASRSLRVYWDLFTSTGALAQVTTDALGSFGAPLKVPAGVAVGQHPLLLFDVDPIEQKEHLLAQTSFLVEPYCWQTEPPLNEAPVITLSPIQGPANGGNVVQVAGSGWRPNAKVRIYWDDPGLCASFPSFYLGQATANALGSFLTSFTVPAEAAGEDHQVVARTDLDLPPMQQALAAYRMIEPPDAPSGDRQAPAVFARHELIALYDGGPVVGVDFVAEAFDPLTSAGAYNGVVRVELWAIALGGSHPLIHKKCTVAGWTPKLACLHAESGPFDPATQGFYYWGSAEDRSGNVISSPVKFAWLIDRGPDADDDGLSDAVEKAICTDPTNPDSDRDNLLDGWEVKGYGFPDGGYVDLPSMGAHPCRPDVFVELDWTSGSQPVAASDLQPVQNAFQDHGVRLHIDHGQWGGGGEITDTAHTAMQGNFDPNRYWSFHYVIYRPGKSFCWRGKIAYVGGTPGAFRAQTLMHELGHCIGFGHGGMTGPNSQQRSGTEAQRKKWGFRWLYYEQDAVTMNNKPNYLSVMSYAWDGLVWVANAGAGSPGFVFRYDYSEEALPNLSEKDLDERASSDFVQKLRAYPLPPRTPSDGRMATIYGCQDPDDKELYMMATDGNRLVARLRLGDPRPAGWQLSNLPGQDAPGIDWDCDGKIEASVRTNVNGASGESHVHAPADRWTVDEVLRGSDDWARIPSIDPCLGDDSLGKGFLQAAHDPPCESNGWLPASRVGYPPGEEPWVFAPPIEYCNGEDDDGDGFVDEGCLDSDSDGVTDDMDNCPDIVNPDQRDSDGNGVGDACSLPPPPPDGLDLRLLEGAAVLSWQPVPSALGYTVLRRDVEMSVRQYLGENWPSTTEPAWRDDPAPSGAAVYEVRAVDRYGQESGEPAEVKWPGTGPRIMLPAVMNRFEAAR